MTTLHLSDDALQLFALCHQAGDHAYLWGHTGDKKSNGTTRWFRPGETPAVFNSQHNNYFGVHPTMAAGNQYQRAKKGVRDIAAVNCLYADLDDKDHGGIRGAARAILEERIASGALPQPTVLVDSGGGVQMYWGLRDPFLLDTPEKRDRADRVQKAWVTHVGSDDGAKDAARVLRVPGTLNYKYDPPRPAAILDADYSRLFSLDELEALLPPEQVKPAKVRTPRQTANAQINQDEIGRGPDFDAIAQAATNLKRLSTVRRDSYSGWVNVGMALAELGAIGYNLWELWSKSSPKYDVGDCAEKWQTFRPASGSDDLSLTSLSRWATEDDPNGRPNPSPEIEQLQRENEDYRKREEWQAKILARKDIKLNEKAVMIGIEPILSLRRNLGCQKEDHTGSVPAAYKRLGELVATSPSTVGKVIDLGEKIDLWRRDPEVKQSKDGYDIQLMRLDLQPAFDNPDLGQFVERKQHGGARTNAGRRPKCPKCPPDTAVVVRAVKRVETQCLGCGDILHTETIPLSAEVIGAEIQDEIGNDAPISAELIIQDEIETTQAGTGIQDETVVVPLLTSVSSLPISVPAILEETLDLTTAIRLADTFSPAEEHSRMAYKTALSWLYRSEPQKALGRVSDIPDPPARAIIEHLAARAIYAQAVTS
jgi:hypothetical protein